VRIRIGHGTVTGLAARTSPCAACGLTLYAEREFASAIGTARPYAVALALAALQERVQSWREEPLVCAECPERRAVAS
jgi:hypothetical protein